MQLFRYAVLALFIFNLPATALKFINPTLGTMLSYGSLLLLGLYYIFESKGKVNKWLILIGLSYYLTGAFQYNGQLRMFLVVVAKYFIVVICGYEAIKRTTKKDLFYFLLIGSLSVAFHMVFFKGDYGRYSGFYINPNVAGFICISGYGLTYGLSNLRLKLLGQFVFTLMGLLTFSRTFIALWLFINVMSIFLDIKNIRIIFLGFLIISTLFTIDELVGLDNPRFQQLKGIIYNEGVTAEEIGQGGRAQTWKKFYKHIEEKPFFGNGYGAFQGGGFYRLGSHNTYLLVIGETGIIPFSIFIGLFIYFLYWGVVYFREAPNILMQSIGLSVFLLANHNFFNFYYITMITMWLHYQLMEHKKSKKVKLLEPNPQQ